MATLTIPTELKGPRDDVSQLHKAFKGLGCSTSTVINILAHRNSEQRDLILQEYETAHDEKLTKRIKSDIHGNLKKAILLWLPDSATRDAIIIRKAFKKSVSDFQAVTEVVCSRTPSQIRRFKEIYMATYHVPLDKEFETNLSGDHKKLLIEYISTPRYEGPEYDQRMVEKDAEELNNACEKKYAADEMTFIRIFSERSSTHLAAVNATYQITQGKSLEKAIKKEASGSFKKALLTILRCATDPAAYFAKILRKSMKGIGTDDSRLMRVIVTRAELDLQFIKAVYLMQYGKSLKDAVRSDTSRHYKEFLLALLGY